MIAREAQLFRVALQFLTVIRIGAIEELRPDWLARSAKYMPLVGALIGAVAGVGVLASAMLFPDPLPTVVGLAVALLLTGALHEDGLADTADAFGGGRSRERVLEIMKDSRIGTYGTLALIVVLALKGGALASMDQLSAARVLIAGHAAARLATIVAISLLSYAGQGNAKVSRPYSTMTTSELAVAVILGLGPGLLVLQSVTFLVSVTSAFIAAGALALYARRRIGGYTGDILGAIEQVFETVFFMFAASVVSGPG